MERGWGERFRCLECLPPESLLRSPSSVRCSRSPGLRGSHISLHCSVPRLMGEPSFRSFHATCRAEICTSLQAQHRSCPVYLDSPPCPFIPPGKGTGAACSQIWENTFLPLLPTGPAQERRQQTLVCRSHHRLDSLDSSLSRFHFLQLREFFLV